MCTYAIFFPPYFSCPFCRFSIFAFLAFSFVFSTLSRKWRRTLFVLELRHLFIRYFVHLVKEIVKLLKKSERWENKWSKVKTLPDKPRSRWPFFFYKLCEKCYRKSSKYMRNNSTRLQGEKKKYKIPVRILLDVLFGEFRFSKASFLPWHLHSWHFKTSSPYWHWDVRKVAMAIL